MDRLLKLFEDFDEEQPFNDDARDIFRTAIVPRALLMMTRFQSSDPMDNWENHPEDAREFFSLMNDIVSLIYNSPPFGSAELYQRRDLDQKARAWRPWNLITKHTPSYDEEDDD